MVERASFTGLIADVLRTRHSSSQEDFNAALLGYVAIYNHELRQSAVQSKTRLRAMKECGI